MTKQRFIPGERHHWWPVSLSQYWADNNGVISRIDINGRVSQSNPRATARISDGHNIRLDSAWDTRFEGDFDHPDGSFPQIVQQLESWVQNHCEHSPSEGQELCTQECCEGELQNLCHCLVSLAVRSPKFRRGVVRFVENVRSNVQKKEHKPLIAANMRQAYTSIIRNISGRGKFLVLFSKSKEFIYGDGFYHNITNYSQYLHDSRILVPITPRIAVLHVLPTQFMVEPRVVTLEANAEIVDLVNETVQVYAKECLYFKSEQPILTEPFLRCEHLVYTSGDPVENIIEKIPGVNMRRDPFHFSGERT